MSLCFTFALLAVELLSATFVCLSYVSWSSCAAAYFTLFSFCSCLSCPSFLSFPFCCLLFFSFLYSFHSSFLFGLKSFRLSLFRLFPTFYCFRRSLFHALKILEVYIPSKKYLSASIGLLSSARASLIVLLAKRSLGRLCVDHGERPQAERSC